MVERRLFASLLAVGFLGATAARGQVIDDFNVDQSCGDFVTPNSATTHQAGATTSIIGGQRTLHLAASGFGGGAEASLSVSGGALSFLRTNSVTATIETWWDAHTGSSIDATTGLGGVNLAASGNDRFNVVVNSATNSPLMLLRVYSSAIAYSDKTFNLPNVGGTVAVLYSSFATGAGASAPADFTSVRAIDLSVNGTTGLAIGSIDSITATQNCAADVQPPTVTAPAAATVTQTTCM